MNERGSCSEAAFGWLRGLATPRTRTVYLLAFQGGDEVSGLRKEGGGCQISGSRGRLSNINRARASAKWKISNECGKGVRSRSLLGESEGALLLDLWPPDGRYAGEKVSTRP